MYGLLSGFLPVVVLAAVGWCAARFGLLGPGAERVLSGLVFKLAMPAALFGMLLHTPLPDRIGQSTVVFAAGTVLLYATGAAVARWVFRRRPAEQALGGMAAGHVNAANLGIPLAIQLFGSASFLAPLLLLQTLVITPILLMVIEADVRRAAAAAAGAGAERAGLAARVRRGLLLPVRNPIVPASALGLLVAEAGWQLPADVLKPVQLLGGAAVPAALIALGMSLRERFAGAAAEEEAAAAELRTSRGEVGVAVALKLFGQPLVTWVIGVWVWPLPPADLAGVLVCSALPTAQNAYLFAREYGLRVSFSRDAVAVSTVGSIFTLSLLIWLLGGEVAGV